MNRQGDASAGVIPIGTRLQPGPAPAGAGFGFGSAGLGRVGVVLVCHSQAVAVATAALALSLAAGEDTAPVAAAGGTQEGGIGTSPLLIAAATRRVDQGHGVAVLADLSGAVQAVRALLAEAEEHGLPFPVRLADAPFLEGAVAAVATASAGGDLAAVVDAAQEAYRLHKL